MARKASAAVGFDENIPKLAPYRSACGGAIANCVQALAHPGRDVVGSGAGHGAP